MRLRWVAVCFAQRELSEVNFSEDGNEFQTLTSHSTKRNIYEQN